MIGDFGNPCGIVGRAPERRDDNFNSRIGESFGYFATEIGVRTDSTSDDDLFYFIVFCGLKKLVKKLIDETDFRRPGIPLDDFFRKLPILVLWFLFNPSDKMRLQSGIG